MTRFLCILALAVSSFVATAEAALKVIVNDQLELRFEDKIRMNQLLDAALVQWRETQKSELDVYWPSVRLAMVGGAENTALAEQEALEAERLNVIEQLNELTNY